MTDTALFVGWGGTHPGREHEARKLFDEYLEILAEAQKQGEIESFEPVILAPHGGLLDGFVLVRGEPTKLMALQMRDDMVAMRLKARTHHAKLSIILAAIGEGAKREIALFDEAVAELGHEPTLV